MIPWVYINFMIPVMHGRAIYERLCQFAHCAVKKGMCKTVQMILCYIIGVCMSSCCREEKSVWWSYWVPGGPSWERFRQEEKSQEEIHRKIGKAWSYSYIYTSYSSYLGKAMLHIYTWANIVSKTEQCTLVFSWNAFTWQWFKPFSPDGWSSGAGPRSFLKDRGHGC